MNEVRTAPESADQSTADASPYKLRGRMGTIGLLFTVLAFTAPLGVVFGFISVNISFGIGVPIAFVGVAVLVGLFALGFTAMTKAVPRPGAFYTYIREGLGRPMGLGGSFLALLTYGFNVTSLMVVAGIAVNNLLQAFSLVATPWWLWSLVLLIAFGALGYFNVELSARVLSVILAVEVVAVLIFDVVVIANGGPQGQSFEPWNPANLITPTLGVLLLFSIGVFNGFEATAIYRDEVRDPAKTIPRATYLAVIFLGVFYAISAYALILSAGASNAVAVATENPTAMMPDALLAYFGMFANQIIAILLVTSFFASGLSLQNILSRYTHSLAVDGIFPKFIAAVHARHGSPYRATLTVSGLLLIVLAVLVISGGDENSLYAAAAGVAFYGMLLLLCLTAIAVIVYFRRNPSSVSAWRTLVAPAIALLGIGFALMTATFNMGLLVVGDSLLLTVLLLIPYAVIVVGVIMAIVLRSSKPATYERIGRAVE
ncbi:APC family permease [Pseudolysinimonas yzui]|uniref:Amino acid transporter n=1 Tax=Pseudolysinimonas yzui TaxID=2708254 RepID=A0A8J3M2C8_9MICO|nr:APC family permease [Pseudolysinimonas yzui]GHF17708.1 amino acid transporter [Pseudolysinimonas yzui]